MQKHVLIRLRALDKSWVFQDFVAQTEASELLGPCQKIKSFSPSESENLGDEDLKCGSH